MRRKRMKKTRYVVKWGRSSRSQSYHHKKSRAKEQYRRKEKEGKKVVLFDHGEDRD